jgi:hypothetical protein
MSAGDENGTSPMEPRESASMDAFWKAWIKMQATLEAVPKDRRNPHLKSTYSSLSAVIEAAGALFANGFGYTQCDVGGFLETKIVHESGQWRASYVEIRCTDNRNAAQGYGAGLTYARRYGLVAALGLASADDDGHSAGAQRARRSAPLPEGTILAELAATATPEDYAAWRSKWGRAVAGAAADVRERITQAANRRRGQLEGEAEPGETEDDVAMGAWS